MNIERPRFSSYGSLIKIRTKEAIGVAGWSNAVSAAVIAQIGKDFDEKKLAKDTFSEFKKLLAKETIGLAVASVFSVNVEYSNPSEFVDSPVFHWDTCPERQRYFLNRVLKRATKNERVLGLLCGKFNAARVIQYEARSRIAPFVSSLRRNAFSYVIDFIYDAILDGLDLRRKRFDLATYLQRLVYSAAGALAQCVVVAQVYSIVARHTQSPSVGYWAEIVACLAWGPVRAKFFSPPPAAKQPVLKTPDTQAYNLKTRQVVEAVSSKNGPYPVDVEEGKTYYYCTCGLSKNQPFCDGSHKELNATKGSQFKPMAFKAEKSEKKFFCGCRKSGTPPFCDGTHSNKKKM